LTAIESSPSACFDFAGNLDEFENISLYEGAVEYLLPPLIEQIKSIDLVVLDPPRGGLNTKARQALIDLDPQQIIYISCDPSTLARDLKHFSEARYSMQSLHAFDMFPQTAHVETVANLYKSPLLN
jgi:23S rRNA (uracil1939-C5)-methyltransferase